MAFIEKGVCDRQCDSTSNGPPRSMVLFKIDLSSISGVVTLIISALYLSSVVPKATNGETFIYLILFCCVERG